MAPCPSTAPEARTTRDLPRRPHALRDDNPEKTFGPASKFLAGTKKGAYVVEVDAKGRLCWVEAE